MPRQPRTTGSRIIVDGINVCAGCGNRTNHSRCCRFKPSNMKTVSRLRANVTVVEEQNDEAVEDMTDIHEDNPIMDNEDPCSDESGKISLDWVNELWNRRKRTLPTLYNFEYADGQHLDRDLWPTPSFKTPSPLNSTQPNLDHFLLPSIDIHVICPHTFYPSLSKDFHLACPACGSEDIQLNGWSNGFRSCMNKSSYSLVKSRRYIHINCPVALQQVPPRASTSFSSIHPNVVKQFPPLLRMEIPFIVFKKLIVHEQLIQEIREGKMVSSMSGIQRCHATLLKTQYMNNLKRYLLACRRLQTHPGLRFFARDYQIKQFPSFDQLPYSAISSSQMTRIYKTEILRLLPLIHGYTSLLHGAALKWDHTFWVAKMVTDENGTARSSCVFTIMNGVGEVLASYFCPSKSLNYLKQELQMFRNRNNFFETAKVVWTDNPTGDANTIRELFGPETLIKRDIQHAFLDYCKGCLQKSNFRKSFIREVVDAFFQTEDIDMEGVFLRYADIYTRDQMKKFPKSWWKRRVRRYTRKKLSQEQILEQIFLRYRNKKLFNSNMTEIHSKIIAHVRQGWYEDPPSEMITMHYNIGTDEKPIFITIRSTSQLENYHRVLRLPMEGCMSELLMHLVYVDVMYRWNINKAIRIRKVPLLNVYDPQLYNDIFKLYEDLGIAVDLRPEFIAFWTSVKPAWDLATGPDPEIHETFGVLRHAYGSEAYQVSQEYVDDISDQLADENFECNDIFHVQEQLEAKNNFLLNEKKAQLQLQGLTRVATPIDNEEQEQFYYSMVVKYLPRTNRIIFESVDHIQMAIDWNIEIHTSILNDSSTVSTTLSQGHRYDKDFPLEKIFLKNSEHLRDHARSLDTRLERRSIFDTNEERRVFYNYRNTLGTVVTTNAPAARLPNTLAIPTPRMASSFELCPTQQIPLSNSHNTRTSYHDLPGEIIPIEIQRAPGTVCPVCLAQRHSHLSVCTVRVFVRLRTVHSFGLERFRGGSVKESIYREWNKLTLEQVELWKSKENDDERILFIYAVFPQET